MTDQAVIANEQGLLSKSLWNATARQVPDFLPLKGDARADVVIVGAGYSGLSTAIHLAERGAQVVVLEAESPGWGASGRNGGQVIPGLKEDPDTIREMFGDEVGERLVRFCGGAPDVVFDLIERYQISCDAARRGWIQPSHDDITRAALERRVEQWSRRGAPIDMLDGNETARLIGSESYKVAALDRRGGSVHPLNYSLGLAEAATRLGVRIHGNSRATALSREDGAFRVETAGGSVRAEHVVLCTNAYADGLDDRLRRSVLPVCSVQVASEPLSANVRATIFPEGHLASDMRRLLIYFRLGPSGNLVMGGRGAFSRPAIQRQMERLRKVAGKIFPQVGEVAWRYHWGGYVAMTTDHFPHLHEPQPGMTAALGYNGRGIAMATAMGRVIADKVMGVSAAQLEYPMSPLKPVPLHDLYRPAVGLAVAWKGWRDRLEWPRSS